MREVQVDGEPERRRDWGRAALIVLAVTLYAAVLWPLAVTVWRYWRGIFGS